MAVYLFLILCFSTSTVFSAYYPPGCTYDNSGSSMGLYICDYTNASFPLKYVNFSEPIPQRIVLYNVYGDLSIAALFEGFGGFNHSAVNSDFTNYLEFSCSNGATLAFSNITFTDMNYIHEFRISNCNMTTGIPSYAFGTFVDLDALTIEGGAIASTQPDTFSGLNITKQSNIPTPQGKLTIKNVVVGSNFSVGFFDPLWNVRAIDISGCGITNLDTNAFLLNNRVTMLNIARNQITSLPWTVLQNMTSLTILDVTGIPWDCSCSNLWFLDHFKENYMKLVGGILCNSPTAYQGKRAYYYFAEECRSTDKCYGIPGIAIGVDCFEWYQILAYSFLFITFVLAWVAFIIVVTYRRAMYKAEMKIIAVKKDKAMRVMEALKRGGGGGQKAPLTTEPKPDLSWTVTEKEKV